MPVLSVRRAPMALPHTLTPQAALAPCGPEMSLGPATSDVVLGVWRQCIAAGSLTVPNLRQFFWRRGQACRKNHLTAPDW